LTSECSQLLKELPGSERKSLIQKFIKDLNFTLKCDPLISMFPGGAAVRIGKGANYFKSAHTLRRHNKQVRAIVNKLNLNKDQAQKLHREVSKQGYSYDEEILLLAKEMFNK
jgi:hypothetical protein